MSNTTPVVAGAFDPNGQSYAYIYRALEAFRLRVTPVVGNSDVVEYVTGKGVQPTCLTWIPYAPRFAKQQTKRRKKTEGEDEPLTYAVAIGTNSGQVLVFSSGSNQLVATLQSTSKSQVCSLSLQDDHLLVLHDDGHVFEWDVDAQKIVKSGVSPLEDSVQILHSSGKTVIATTSPTLVDEDFAIASSMPGFASAITQITAGASENVFVAIAENDRLIHSYSLESGTQLGCFSCPSNVQHISISGDDSAVAAVAEDGKIYIFEGPFESQATSHNKKKRKALTMRKPDLRIGYERPNGQALPVLQTRFLDNFLVVSWNEHGNAVIFDRVRWRDPNKQILSGPIVVVKELSIGKTDDSQARGADPAAAKAYNEASSTVTSGYHVASLEDNEEAEETLADRLDALDVSQSSSDDDEDELEESGEEDQATERIKKAEHRRRSKQTKNDNKLKLSAPGTFSALLTQALVSDDKQLLEECLNVNDESMIKASIIKLEPALAAALLEKLAERIARVQHRAGTLSQWAKWVIIVHGGYLVTVPNLMKSLANLHLTLNSRVSNLPRLQALQGRLELLDSQLEIRRAVNAHEIEDDTEDVPEFVYDDAVIVNGEEDFDDEPLDDSGSDVMAVEIDGAGTGPVSDKDIASDSDASSYAMEQSSDAEVSLD